MKFTVAKKAIALTGAVSPPGFRCRLRFRHRQWQAGLKIRTLPK